MKKIVVAGHICLDITPTFPMITETMLAEILVPGKLINVAEANVNTGGVVGNTGLGLKILGADVALMGMVGKDSFGGLVLSLLEKYNLAESMLISENAETSYSIVLAIPGFDRIFLHNPGANHSFNTESLDYEVIKNAALFHFGYPPLMRSMYQNDGQALIHMMKTIKKLGVATSLDMAAVDPSSDAGLVDWFSIIKNVISYVDFFVPSIEELMFMIKPEKYRELRKKAKNKDITEILSLDDIMSLGDILIEWGAKVVLIKCGALGMYFCTGNSERLESIGDLMEGKASSWAERSHFEQSYEPKSVKSATGAGDTSVAAFLYAMTEGYSWEDCLRLATATGSTCVETYDAISGLCTLDEMFQKIENGWPKQNLLCV